jgi:tripartite-type tricarboxylate transporter receptor subunit TctC
MKRVHVAFAAGAVALLSGICALAPAQAAEPFYKGKTVTLYVTSGTGGSVDLMARLGARHLGKHIPGNPTVIVKNKPGAGGVVGANFLFSQARKDGTELGSALMTVPFEPLFYGKRSVAKFDPLKFNYLGSPVKFIAVAVSWHTSPVKKWQDLLERELIVGSSGMGSSSTVDAFVMRSILGFKYKLILGYPSGSDIDLAMIRGETNGRATTAWAGITSRHPDWLTKKKVNLLYQMGLEKHPSVPSTVPLLINHVKDAEKLKVLKLKMAAYETGYPLFAPPGVPAKRVALLRKAYADTFKDPAFLKDAKRSRVEIGPITGKKVAAILKEAYGAPADIKAKLQAASVPPSQKPAKAKTVKINSKITKITKKGRGIAFMNGGKAANASLGKKTKISVGGKKAKRGALKAGMACDIEYFGEKGQAKTVKCK